VRLRILLSFHYFRKKNLDEMVAEFPEPPEIFADSGAFSAKSVGATIDRLEYQAWLQKWDHLFTTYANLDVIGDAAATRVNQQLMEADGFKPLPVFHGGEPWEYLAEYCRSHAYVALGGMVATGGAPAVLRWATQAFKVAKATGTVFHGFGQTTRTIVAALPWYSIDSSAWASGHRYGTLHLWDDSRARFVQARLGDRKSIYTNAGLIRAHGGEPAELSRPGYGAATSSDDITRTRGERSKIIAINVISWLRLEAWLRQRHGEVRMYLVDSPANAQQLELAKTATTLSSGGPEIYVADARANVERQDLAIAADHLATGPKVFLAHGTDSVLSSMMADEPGPKIYLAEADASNLIRAGDATREWGGQCPR
jgi:hypothetical protein